MKKFHHMSIYEPVYLKKSRIRMEN